MPRPDFQIIKSPLSASQLKSLSIERESIRIACDKLEEEMRQALRHLKILRLRESAINEELDAKLKRVLKGERVE